jgi:hypothetical protein
LPIAFLPIADELIVYTKILNICMIAIAITGILIAIKKALALL